MQLKNIFSGEYNVCSIFMKDVKYRIMLDHTILYKPTVRDYIVCGSTVALVWFIQLLVASCICYGAIWAMEMLIKRGLAWYWIAAIVLYIAVSATTGICARNKARAKADKDE